MIAPGRVPVRDPANKMAGRAPVPGWDASYDWKGYLRFEDLPRIVDPPAGAIGTANAAIVGPDYPHHLTYDWDPEYRQRRVKELIVDRDGHDMASMRAAQADTFSPPAQRLQALMVAMAQAGGFSEAALLDQLTTWDGVMRADAPEPLIFTAWLREANRAIYSDDLGAAFARYFDERALALTRLLEGRATSRDWCDDRTTPARERCSEVLARSLAAALADLEKRYGKDRTKWRWGAAHYAHGEHRPLGVVAGLSRYFNVDVRSPGGSYTLNRGKADFGEAEPFANRHASSYRAIYDLADLDRSLYIHTTGQSGNALSPFYRSFAERWARVEYIEIASRREEIAKAAIGTWKLTPP
jgi:penicillin amidase